MASSLSMHEAQPFANIFNILMNELREIKIHSVGEFTQYHKVGYEIKYYLKRNWP